MKKKAKLASKNKKVFNAERVEKDIVKLITRHNAKGLSENISLMTEGTKSDEGFFLVFIRRDNKRKENKYNLITFGCDMDVLAIVEAFKTVLDSLIQSPSRENIPVV